jgi:phosphatidylethanolamine/phosphatidyl-N-methylethanolamine N-methyltransferase
MDAERLGFANAFFDVVVAQFVITAVPDPEAALDEFARVVKPRGEIVLVNHLGAETGLRRAYEHSFAPLVRHLGWRMEFPFARLDAWARRAGYRVVERRAVQPLGHFTLMRFRKATN